MFFASTKITSFPIGNKKSQNKELIEGFNASRSIMEREWKEWRLLEDWVALLKRARCGG